MTITDVATINYEPQQIPRGVSEHIVPEQISIWKLPKLVWAGVALFTMNAVIGVGMFITPNIAPDMYGHEVKTLSSNSLKPSPFTEVIDTRKHKVQLAAKARPILVNDDPMMGQQDEQLMDAAAAVALDLPRTSRVAYQLDLPARTQSAVYEVSSPTLRKREQDRKFAVIN